MTPDELIALRHRCGLPQSDFAAVLGLARTTLIALEQGRARPNRLILMAIAAYMEGLDPYSADPNDLISYRAAGRKRIDKPQGRKRSWTTAIDASWPAA